MNQLLNKTPGMKFNRIILNEVFKVRKNKKLIPRESAFVFAHFFSSPKEQKSQSANQTDEPK